MLGVGDGFFFDTSSQSASRTLRPATVLGLSQERYTARLDEEGITLEKDAEFLIYFELRNKFVKQAAKIVEVHEEGPHQIIEFTTRGEPVSAESRQTFRVSTVIANLTATLGKEKDCKLLDVSAIGFSVIARTHHGRGAIVDASLSYQGKTYTGKACVQSSRPLDKEKIRYGLHSVDARASANSLEAGLRHMAMAVQREQLRRLAGTA